MFDPRDQSEGVGLVSNCAINCRPSIISIPRFLTARGSCGESGRMHAVCGSAINTSRSCRWDARFGHSLISSRIMSLVRSLHPAVVTPARSGAPRVASSSSNASVLVRPFVLVAAKLATPWRSISEMRAGRHASRSWLVFFRQVE